MATVKTFAVIPTKDRTAMLRTCIESLRDQVEKIVIINTHPEGVQAWPEEDKVVEIPCYVSEDNPPNISYWWNLGMDCVDVLAEDLDEWNILVVNDDLIAFSGLVEKLSTAMRDTTAVLASPNQSGESLIFQGEDSLMDYDTRLTGYIYMLRGERHIRIDESLKWWWSDTDLDYRARKLGGAVKVPHCPVVHLDPNGYTTRDPYLNRQTLLDRETFIQKWGLAPW